MEDQGSPLNFLEELPFHVVINEEELRSLKRKAKAKATGVEDIGCSSSRRGTSRSQILESLEKKIQISTNNFESLKDYGRTWLALIYRIPVEIREVNERAYTPSVVSIGPLHRESQHLQAMEQDKLSYMQCLFFHFDNSYHTRQRCVDAMLDMESVARNWYSELKIRADNEVATKAVKFEEMILIDGCFIIELLYRNYKRSTGYIISDPILDNYSMRSAVQHDLIRLENQIPFFVLDKLFSLTVATIPEDDGQFSLRKCIFLFFKGMMGLLTIPNWDPATPSHILDFLHSCYLPSASPVLDTKQPLFKYSATQLDLAGVKFKPHPGKSLFDIQFYTDHSFHVFRSGRLEIPPFSITSSTEPFLRNLIAIEQFYADRYRCFTSHAFLMDKLINTAKDVDLLVEAGVIHNYLGSSEEVAHLYNNICKNVYVGGFHFTKPCSQVTDYCNLF